MLNARVVSVALVAIASIAGCSTRASSPPSSAPARDDVAALAAIAAQTKAPRAVDLSLGSTLAMTRPIVDGRLTLVPIVATAPTPDTSYLTLTAGMASGQVTVREMPAEWEVQSAMIKNRSRQPLFVMSGELVIEAKQDRVIAESRVIAPGEQVAIPVRCVEAEREHGGSQFRSGGAIAELTLRQTVRFLDQSAVWAQVNKINARLELRPSTETYRGAAQEQTAGAARARRDRLIATLQALPERDHLVGVAVAIDGQLLTIDRFTTPALYQALEPELVASYAASTRDAAPGEAKVVPEAVRRFADAYGPGVATDASNEVLRSLDPTPED